MSTSLLPLNSTSLQECESFLQRFQPDHYAHILHPRYTPEMLIQARIEGKEVQAWCGYHWSPSRDPRKLPLCQTCQNVHSAFDKRPLMYC